MLAADHLTEGKHDSAVRVVIYEDLQCSDCAVFRQMLDAKLLPRYGSRVAFEHRDFPLAKHAWARKAAIAARYFDQVRPGLGLKFRQYCFAHQPEIDAEHFDSVLQKFAKENQLDPAKAVAALDDTRLAALVENDFQDGVARGIAHTPTALLDGDAFVETIRYEDLSKALDDRLASAKQENKF